MIHKQFITGKRLTNQIQSYNSILYCNEAFESFKGSYK